MFWPVPERRALLAGAVLLAGCASPGPETAPAPPADPNVLTLDLPPAMARTRAETLAAGCWLSGPFADAIMTMDRRAGRITLDGEARLLTMQVEPADPQGTTVRLAGAAMAEPARADSLRRDVLQAVGEGIPAC